MSKSIVIPISRIKDYLKHFLWPIQVPEIKPTNTVGGIAYKGKNFKLDIDTRRALEIEFIVSIKVTVTDRTKPKAINIESKVHCYRVKRCLQLYLKFIL